MNAQARPKMTRQEAALLSAELGEQSPVLTLCTGTRVDTGRWWRRSRLWLIVTECDLLLLAARKRRFIQRQPLSACRDSTYAHTTGMLLLEPRETWRYAAVSLPPTDAMKVLGHLETAGTTPTESTSPVTEPTGA